MRDYTNLQWPEAPFGAEQRPFGRRSPMLAAFALDWANPEDARPLPVAAATVYLRVRRHGPHGISDNGLSIGFRAVARPASWRRGRTVASGNAALRSWSTRPPRPARPAST